MNELENELRRALERRRPPPGFADRVMAAVPERRKRTFSLRWLFGGVGFPRAWAPVTAALLITALGTGSWEYHRAQERRREAEEAKAELIYALELTSAKLESTRTRLLRQIGGHL